MKKNIEKVHQVIADLDEEMNWMRDNADREHGIISAEGHRRMIASLDEFCESIGMPCATFDDLNVHDEISKYVVVLDKDCENGHSENLELEVVLYDSYTMEDLSDTFMLKFKTSEQMDSFAKMIGDNRINLEEMYRRYDAL